jgi:peptidoglycan hydrolase CwlO-like protein
MREMKKLIFLIFVIGLAAVAFVNEKAVAAEANNLLYYSPCDTPKTFRIGTIDPRFHLSKTQVLNDAEVAASAWKNSKGMILMQYNPNSDLPINMVYDQRQSLDTQINNLDNKVAQQKKSLKPEIDTYNEKMAALKKQSDALNAQIQYWNSKGGAPQNIYNNLISQQQNIQQQATQLQQTANQLNQSTDQYNSQVNQLNQKVDSYNIVLSYKPEEGIYIRSGTSETINIYFDNSQQELIHTIAHEMGHALGLGHNKNPQSIMFPYTNLVTTPSGDDENALAAVCKKRSIFEIAEEGISLAISNIKQNISNLTSSQN